MLKTPTKKRHKMHQNISKYAFQNVWTKVSGGIQVETFARGSMEEEMPSTSDESGDRGDDPLWDFVLPKSGHFWWFFNSQTH